VLLMLLSCRRWTGWLLVGCQQNGRVHVERYLLLLLLLLLRVLLLVGCQHNGRVHVGRGLLLLLLLWYNKGSARRRLTRLDDLHDLRVRQPPSPAITVPAHSVSACVAYTAGGIWSSATARGAHSGESCTGFQGPHWQLRAKNRW